MSSPVLRDDLRGSLPLIYEGQSDTACFDNALELLTMSGYPLAHAMMMMIPEAWEQHTLMDDSRRAFYEYHAAMMEPWDGPAAIAFTDGVRIGATLDRNGLRPALHRDRRRHGRDGIKSVCCVPESRITKKWRLQPGKMFLIDTEQGRHRRRGGSSLRQASRIEWVGEFPVKPDDLPSSSEPGSAANLAVPLLDRQQAFRFTRKTYACCQCSQRSLRKRSARWATTRVAGAFRSRQTALASNSYLRR